jgi:hypothetical protein
MILELNDDFSDDIVIRSLAESYVSISANLKDSEMCWHEDDKQAWKEMLPAIMLVGGWYSVDFKKDIKKAKQRK